MNEILHQAMGGIFIIMGHRPLNHAENQLVPPTLEKVYKLRRSIAIPIIILGVFY